MATGKAAKPKKSGAEMVQEIEAIADAEFWPAYDVTLRRATKP